MLDWNDLRLVLAIARSGSLAGAGRALGVNHSTVFRRLNACEGAMGVRLFERTAQGYAPTAAGERLVAAAERIETEVIEADRELTGRDHRLAGRLRVTSSETLAFRVLTRHLAAFRRLHPGIQVELAIDNRQLDLSKREADVALRADRPMQGDLYGRKLADIAWSVYGARTYLAEHGRPPAESALSEHQLIGWDAAATRLKAAAWLAGHAPPEAIAYRCGSLLNQLVAAKTGIGLAVLPCYLADPEPELERVLAPLPDLATELWLITHRDLRNTARVRAFMDAVGDALAREREAFAGRARDSAAVSD
jgi:DNA-binding transcriptional LysR family regulator